LNGFQPDGSWDIKAARAAVDAVHATSNKKKKKKKGGGASSAPSVVPCVKKTAPIPSGQANTSAATNVGTRTAGIISLPAMPVHGLSNLGNTCFMNASLQALSASPSFLAYACSPPLKLPLNKHAASFCEKLAGLFSSMQASGKKPISPKSFVATLEGPFRDRSMEHDAHEFTVMLRDQLDIVYKPRISPFVGMHKNCLTCVRCNYKKFRDEQFEEIQLVLPHMRESTVTLEELLQVHTGEDRVSFTGDNKVDCGRCGGRRDTVVQVVPLVLPTALLIQLKRFKWNAESGNFEKILIPVQIPKVLTIQSETYLHKATVTHIGATPRQGHYYAYKRNFSDGGVQYNDSVATELSPAEFHKSAMGFGGNINETPYMLVYEKTTGSAVLPGAASVGRPTAGEITHHMPAASLQSGPIIKLGGENKTAPAGPDAAGARPSHLAASSMQKNAIIKTWDGNMDYAEGRPEKYRRLSAETVHALKCDNYFDTTGQGGIEKIIDNCSRATFDNGGEGIVTKIPMGVNEALTNILQKDFSR